MQEPESQYVRSADRRAELVEERVADVEPVEDALGAEVADRHDRFGPCSAMVARNRVGDLVERRVPGDPFEAAAALRPAAAHRVEQPVGVVDLVDVVVDLDAQPAPGEGVVGVQASKVLIAGSLPGIA